MSVQKDRMLRGDLYDANDTELTDDRLRSALLVERFNVVSAADDDEHRRLLSMLLGHVGESAEVKAPLQCDYGFNIHIGDRSFVNYGAIIVDCAPVVIGDDVQIGPAVQLLTATHPLDHTLRKKLLESAMPITIGDGVWFGGGVIVCPDVTIGENTVVGAGSVVTKSLPAHVLAVGNPARVIREV